MKKIVIFSSIFTSLLIIGSGVFVVSFAGSSATPSTDYPGKIAECLDAKKESRENSITEYTCLGGGASAECSAYQVVIDLKFQEVDKKVAKWFEELSSAKSKGTNPAELQKKINDAFGISSSSGFYQEYSKICNNGDIINVVSKYFTGGLSTDKCITDVAPGSVTCNNLVKQQLQTYQNAAWSVAIRNIAENYTADKKIYTDKVKDKYDTLLDKFMIYTGKLAEIKDKWDTKTKKQQ